MRADLTRAGIHRALFGTAAMHDGPPYWEDDPFDDFRSDAMPENLLVHYAEFDGRHVAWTATGSGPPLVLTGWWCSHLELNWADGSFRDFVTRLARTRTVIRYDRPGTGLSAGPEFPPRSLQDEYEVLAGFLDALALDRVSLLAGSSGCATAAVYAARHPGRVDRLVLCGGYARGADVSSPSARDALIAAVRTHWGLGSRVLADVFLPDASALERAEFAEFQRRCMSAEQAADALRATYDLDCTPELAAITVPTLVVHRREDRAVPVELGRDLAAAIDGAAFVVREGSDHFPWRGEGATMADDVLTFLDGDVPARAAVVPQPEELTAREREVLALIARGFTDLEVASALVLSPHTVHRHVANIRTKLRVSTRAAAVAWATGHDLL